jgi:hypothetical protein
MSAVNLGTARILIIVALVAAGALILANGFEDEPASDAASPSSSATSPAPSVSSSPSTSASASEPPSNTPAPETSGVLIMVLNGTNVTGLAGEAQQMLEGEGYEAPVDAGNAPSPGVEVTTVYYRPGENAAQNKADATYISETFFPGSKVAKLAPEFDEIVVNSVTVAIVVGDDYAQSVAA